MQTIKYIMSFGIFFSMSLLFSQKDEMNESKISDGISGLDFSQFKLSEEYHSYHVKIDDVKRGYIELYKDGVWDEAKLRKGLKQAALAGVSGGLYNTYEVYDSNAPTKYVTIQEVILLSDRNPYGSSYSAVTSISYAELDDVIHNRVSDTIIEYDKVSYKTLWLLKNAVKYESATITPDKSRVIVATSFNSLDNDTPERSGYNSFISWEKGNPQSASLTRPTVKGDYLSSDKLRKEVQEILKREISSDIGWLNIEAMTAVNDDTLLLGVRQIGSGIDASGNIINLRDIAVLLSAKYTVGENGVLNLTDITYFTNLIDKDGEFDLNDMLFEQMPEMKEVLEVGLGISSMEYDFKKEKLYFLTSYEENGGEKRADIGTFLWVMDIDLINKKYSKPYLVKTDKVRADGSYEPFHSKYKMETLIMLPDDYILLVADDDDVLDEPDSDLEVKRMKLNHAVYEIIKVIE